MKNYNHLSITTPNQQNSFYVFIKSAELLHQAEMVNRRAIYKLGLQAVRAEREGFARELFRLAKLERN